MIQSTTRQADPLLAALPELLIDLIEYQLSNNEADTDEELRDYFIRRGLSPAQADRAVEYRDDYLSEVHWGRETPIRGGGAQRCNSQAGRVETEKSKKSKMARR
ncbi:hypothetical protein [Lysobacter sp. ESA13C]|uniref:hypothetical protein n=1 Tax=Lysobacter sp. ESA13C TaxID=2862676 RepID=UPI001CBFEA6B|nr:hypothetical protein [Lysobacter sp. ESA13C]